MLAKGNKNLARNKLNLRTRTKRYELVSVWLLSTPTSIHKTLHYLSTISFPLFFNLYTNSTTFLRNYL